MSVALIFSDGFESGSACVWSQTCPAEPCAEVVVLALAETCQDWTGPGIQTATHTVRCVDDGTVMERVSRINLTPHQWGHICG